MKKILVFIIFFFTVFSLINSQGILRLSEKINSNISQFFKNKHNITYSIIRFDNSTSLSDLELQRFYHLIVTPLEKSENGIFKDFLRGFNNSKGTYDLSRINEITHFISIKIIENMGKLGAGIIIYNRNSNRIVSIRYFEEAIVQPEVALLGISDPGLSSMEYRTDLDMKIDQDILDLSSIEIKGSQYVFILSENKVDIYLLNGDSIKKTYSNKIKWGRPYYPAIHNEGNLFLFSEENSIYLCVGTNFSKFTHIYKFENSVLKKITNLDFIVRDIFQLNDIKYFAGFNFNFGKNFYKGKLYLKQFHTDDFKRGETFIKDLPDFYSASFYKEENEFKSLFLIDRDYKLRVFSDTIKEVSGKDFKFGSAVAIMENLIALSDYSEKNDNLKIFKIGDNIGNPIFNKAIEGSIKTIKRGKINGKTGFWVIIEKNEGVSRRSRVQFWRKNID